MVWTPSLGGDSSLNTVGKYEQIYDPCGERCSERWDEGGTRKKMCSSSLWVYPSTSRDNESVLNLVDGIRTALKIGNAIRSCLSHNTEKWLGRAVTLAICVQ